MRHIYGILLAMLLCGCGGGTEPSNSAAPQAVAPSESTGPIVFMGDSITAYWTTLPAQDINMGVPGDTTVQMLARFSDALNEHPGILVILGGTNDIRHIANPTIDNIATMADEAVQQGAIVVLSTLPPINDWSAGMPVDAMQGNAEVLAWNQSLRDLAHSKGYRLADYYPVLVLPNGAQNPALFNDDHLHPDPAGYAVMWPILQPLLN